MDRLTRKTNGKDYCTYCRLVELMTELKGKQPDDFYDKPEEYYDRFPYQENSCGNDEERLIKLGKIEDLMDEYNIHSVEELSQVLEKHCENGEILYFCDRCGCQSLRKSDSYCPECGGKIK